MACSQSCIFSLYIIQGAKQNGITLDEAIARVMACGIRAIDVGADEVAAAQKMRAAGMRVASVYGSVELLDDVAAEKSCDELIGAAKTLGSQHVMALPQAFPKCADENEGMAKTIDGLCRLVAKAKSSGITVTVENFGAASSPCARISSLKKLFDGVPELKFTLDTGNFLVVGDGDDPVNALELFRNRIVHCHVKDFYRGEPLKWCPFGEGCIPNDRIVKSLISTGYDGYFTLEGRLAPDFLQAAEDAERELIRYLGQ